MCCWTASEATSAARHSTWWRTVGACRPTGRPAATSPRSTRRTHAPAASFCVVSPTCSSRRRKMTRLAGTALAMAAEGLMRPVIARTYPLSSADEAHRAMEARAISGKALLIP
ncbi:zinc-binding dehydrogenase [Micromonospora sp. NPDC005171]|uniref:zinc-binding dehydrogenase n=1 Tax=Micromonospora sp. NPDC005171 TaxID=3156866 RepID=UPI0033BA62D8